MREAIEQGYHEILSDADYAFSDRRWHAALGHIEEAIDFAVQYGINHNKEHINGMMDKAFSDGIESHLDFDFFNRLSNIASRLNIKRI